MLGAWGLHGELKIELLGPGSVLDPQAEVEIGGHRHRVQASHNSGRHFRLKLAGVDSREEAAALRGRYLQAKESALPPLPEGEFYRFQLIGLEVRSTDGQDLGRISEVISTAGNEVFVVDGPTGEILIPYVDDVVQNVDLSAGVVVIEAVPGLLPPGLEA